MVSYYTDLSLGLQLVLTRRLLDKMTELVRAQCKQQPLYILFSFHFHFEPVKWLHVTDNYISENDVGPPPPHNCTAYIPSLCMECQCTSPPPLPVAGTQTGDLP